VDGGSARDLRAVAGSGHRARSSPASYHRPQS